MADTKNRTGNSSNSHRRPNEPRDSRGRFKEGSIIDSARARPIAAAAAMTAVTAVAAAAGAYLWSKRASTPLMNWGQDDQADDSSSFDSAYAPDDGNTTSPSADAAAMFGASGRTTPSGGTGLDDAATQTTGDATKVGSVAYGA